MKNWLKKKLIIVQFNYYNSLYCNNLKRFHPQEQDRLRTIKNSFDFHICVTSNIGKIEQELNLFKNLVNYRLKQKKYNFA